MTLAKVVRKGSYQGVPQWGISTSAEITPSRATAEKWARLENVGKPKPEYLNTEWTTASYDVWGNARDGYEVNDVYRHQEPITIRCEVTTYNAGTPQEFKGASPSDTQIRQALGLRRFKIETDGDDMVIYVNRARDGYPCGELQCVSHESLSPIRAKVKQTAKLNV